MYTLQVFYPGSDAPNESHRVSSSAEVLARIPELLQAHGGCDRIVVMGGNARLFSVDCKGNRVPA